MPQHSRHTSVTNSLISIYDILSNHLIGLQLARSIIAILDMTSDRFAILINLCDVRVIYFHVFHIHGNL